MLEYSFQPDNETLSIVAPDILLNGVLYHGTSAAYSPHIDKSGLTIDHVPIGKEALNNVAAFLEKLLTSLKDDQEVIKMIGVLNNQFKIHTISMTLIGYAAVKYATSPLKGGQIIKILADAVQLINAKLDQLPGGELENQALRSEGAEVSQPVVSLCEKVSAADGGIYLVQVDKDLSQSLDMPGLPVACNVSITVNKILAKVIIPAGTVFDESLNPMLEKIHRQQTFKRGTIGHKLKQKNMGIDDESIDDSEDNVFD